MTGMYTGLQFAKTFDTIYDNQVQEYMVLLAMRTQEWAEAETVRPPLNLLAIPLQGASRCINWLRGVKGRHANDGGSGGASFYQVLKKDTDSKQYNANMVEEWITAISESKRGTDEDTQGRESTGSYLSVFSDIVVRKPGPLVHSMPENDGPFCEAGGGGSNELQSAPTALTRPMDVITDAASDPQPPLNEHSVPQRREDVAQGDGWSDAPGEGEYSVPNEESGIMR
jgi:hypothetical protein